MALQGLECSNCSFTGFIGALTPADRVVGQGRAGAVTCFAKMNVIDLLVLFCTPSCLAVGIIQSYEDVVRIIQAAEVAYPEYDDGTHATKMRKVSHDLISHKKKKY